MEQPAILREADGREERVTFQRATPIPTDHPVVKTFSTGGQKSYVFVCTEHGVPVFQCEGPQA